MPVAFFPDPREATEDGLVAIGGDLHTDTLRRAYSAGIFPWPHRGLPLLWFSPDPRAVLDFDKLHVPERLARKKRNTPLTFTIDAAFDDVIEACKASPRAGQDGTWITAPMLRAYKQLHRLGDAHSVEAWDESGNLVGGLYGVTAGGYFSGESMFYRASDASKLCVLHLVEYLAAQGATWLDVQTMTPHFAGLGATDIPRDAFLARLECLQQG
ncbi:MAG: leucyl/phenylalanyl-tRNA--protein transferase [Armatimonas sp.]